MTRRLFLVAGSAGSGKSTLAKALAHELDAGWLQLDSIWLAMKVAAGEGTPARDVLDIDRRMRREDEADDNVLAAGLVQGLYARISQRHDLTPVQAKLLCILAEGPRGMAELAQCFGVEKAALTGLVDRVERRGLAKRTPVRGDRRALHVTLTDAGRRAATAFHGEVTIELEHLLSPLAPIDREHFRRAMAAVIAGCRGQPSGTLAGAAANRVSAR